MLEIYQVTYCRSSFIMNSPIKNRWPFSGETFANGSVFFVKNDQLCVYLVVQTSEVFAAYMVLKRILKTTLRKEFL